jgi:hypothetical protein
MYIFHREQSPITLDIPSKLLLASTALTHAVRRVQIDRFAGTDYVFECAEYVGPISVHALPEEVHSAGLENA